MPPIIKEALVEKSCDEEGSILLECRIEAEPRPVVKWYKDDQLIHNTLAFTQSYDGKKPRLFIVSMKKGDEGLYKCEAKNVKGEAFTQAYIKVIGKYFRFQMVIRIWVAEVGGSTSNLNHEMHSKY